MNPNVFVPHIWPYFATAAEFVIYFNPPFTDDISTGFVSVPVEVWTSTSPPSGIRQVMILDASMLLLISIRFSPNLMV